MSMQGATVYHTHGLKVDGDDGVVEARFTISRDLATVTGIMQEQHAAGL